jgi:putative protease
MTTIRPLELLAPAKNLECGKAAIDHGADAVYIGAQRFGARAAAGNSVADIAELCRYAHPFGAKVYVTVNTIVYDDELDALHRLLTELQEAGVDAILVQDMALMQFALGTSVPPTLAPLDSVRHQAIHLHASTQTDNRTAEKVAWLRDQGFCRVVLARELSIDEIRAIHQAVPDVELEVFVHGALCVSYSGLCYASQYCFQRSANRGECAQFCRMAFDLLDADGRLLERNRHLLSLKDLCQIDNLEALAEAGATSFKIEGRLKDIGYVKNVTAAYSQRLDALVRQHPDRYRRASRGRVCYTFEPNLSKTFNRGYTTYFAHGRQPDIASFDTPKAMGEFVGTVKELRRDSLTVAGTARFANGDGLCFIAPTSSAGRSQATGAPSATLQGFRVNRVEGNRLFPQHLPDGLHPGLRLYRNSDQAFERLLSRPSAERKVPISLSLTATADGFALTATPYGHVQSPTPVTVLMAAAHQQAEKPQHENIIRQLTKLGGTPYECTTVDIPADFNYFIPSSRLAELRRQLVDALTGCGECPKDGQQFTSCDTTTEQESTDGSQEGFSANRTSVNGQHLDNIANHVAARFYGVCEPTAYELHPTPDAVLMQCRHCLRYALGRCVRHGGRRPEWTEPLFLRLGDGRRFRLEFDCKACQMNVYAAPGEI